MKLQMESAKRAVNLADSLGFRYDYTDAAMDLDAANEDCPLDFKALLGFDDANFGHDVFGIRRHLNRETLKLENCFVPRCAK
jgi:hypothetical protein